VATKFARALRGAQGVALAPPMKMLRLVFCFLLLTVSFARAQETESLADRTLRQLLERQKELLAMAADQGDNLDESSFRLQIEDVCRRYEVLLRENPKFTLAYTAYGYLLGKLGQDEQAVRILLKSNELDPNQPLVKNQIGNYLAENGKPLDALPYYTAAIKLAPEEPLYHYQLGMLLHEGGEEFVRSGEWRPEALERASHEAFRKAAELAPDRLEFTYRYAESFYDVGSPDWDAAMKAWEDLEDKAATKVERETMRLHQANILIKLRDYEEARDRLDSITEPALQKQKQKLIAQLAGKTDN